MAINPNIIFFVFSFHVVVSQVSPKNSLEKLSSEMDEPVEKAEAHISRPFHLTEDEEKIFQFLLEVQSTYFPDVILRVAGGWVRDKVWNALEINELIFKVMGAQNDDIDIACNVYGPAFAEKVRDHLIVRGHGERSLGIMLPNHEAGQHLARATIQVFGMPISLRSLTHPNTQECLLIL